MTEVGNEGMKGRDEAVGGKPEGGKKLVKEAERKKLA